MNVIFRFFRIRIGLIYTAQSHTDAARSRFAARHGAMRDRGELELKNPSRVGSAEGRLEAARAHRRTARATASQCSQARRDRKAIARAARAPLANERTADGPRPSEMRTRK
jgi:hypothetical protein